MSYIGYALRVAKEFYPKDKYDHAIRVANYIAENDLIPDDKMDDCIALAIMHDLLEDTKYQINNGLEPYFNNCLKLITKPQEQSYIDYIKNIRKHADSHKLTYWVKLADMKDHLVQRETLTDKLKEKYLEAMPYLL